MTHIGQLVGRLAMREEGDNWNAYYAQTGTMEGAIYLGSIKRRFVDSPERKDAFMFIMREAVADLIEEQVGTRPCWGGPQPAPENERSGNS